MRGEQMKIISNGGNELEGLQIFIPDFLNPLVIDRISMDDQALWMYVLLHSSC